jgi:DNA excision repair protein ERCC-2
MAIVLSKAFMRSISQSTNENMQTGVSLWTLQDVLKEQLKQKQADAANMEPPSVGARMEIDEGEYDEYDNIGLPDNVLAAADLDILE